MEEDSLAGSGGRAVAFDAGVGWIVLEIEGMMRGAGAGSNFPERLRVIFVVCFFFAVSCSSLMY